MRLLVPLIDDALTLMQRAMVLLDEVERVLI